MGIKSDFPCFLAIPMQKNGSFFIHQIENNNPILNNFSISPTTLKKIKVMETINHEIGKNSHLPNGEIREIAHKKSKEIRYTKKHCKRFQCLTKQMKVINQY